MLVTTINYIVITLGDGNHLWNSNHMGKSYTFFVKNALVIFW